MDIKTHNRLAWDKRVERGHPRTIPVSSEIISAARKGKWNIRLAGNNPVPKTWLPNLVGLDILGLGSGGGQQAPILAAAGARVTVLDISPKQLAQDRKVAERESLTITLVEGDLSDLTMFQDEKFDLILNPISLIYVPNVLSVWSEAFRVLRHNGILISAFLNPTIFCFDKDSIKNGEFKLKYSIPYSDIISSESKKQNYHGDGPLEFSHTLEDLVGGQLSVGFTITNLAEKYDEIFAHYFPVFDKLKGDHPCEF